MCLASHTANCFLLLVSRYLLGSFFLTVVATDLYSKAEFFYNLSANFLPILVVMEEIAFYPLLHTFRIHRQCQSWMVGFPNDLASGVFCFFLPH